MDPGGGGGSRLECFAWSCSDYSRPPALRIPANLAQILDPFDPDTESRLSIHNTTFPVEQAPLTDTAQSVYGKPRVSSSLVKFSPVGHISLDDFNPYAPELDRSGERYVSISFTGKHSTSAFGCSLMPLFGVEHLDSSPDRLPAAPINLF
jgi:hypothetical protein